ncbi:hypothetical protein ACOSP7_020894 [Xanthoceras sorbifolium]
MADNHVYNAMIKSCHDLVVQYKAGKVEEWRPDEWIADYRELVGEVDAEETVQVESVPQDKQAREEDKEGDEVVRPDVPPAVPSVVLGLVAPSSTQSQAEKGEKEEEKEENAP